MKIDSEAIRKEVEKQLKEKSGSEPLFSERPEPVEPQSDKPKLRVFLGRTKTAKVFCSAKWSLRL